MTTETTNVTMGEQIVQPQVTRINLRNKDQWYDIAIPADGVDKMITDIQNAVDSRTGLKIVKDNGLPSFLGAEWLSNCVADVYIAQPQVSIVPIGGTPAADTLT